MSPHQNAALNRLIPNCNFVLASADFGAFYFSCFDRSYGAVHNGLDVPALLRLRDQERVEAEQLILKAIGTDLDADRPIRAAGHLKLKSASGPLKQRLASPSDNGREYNRVLAAWALYQIEQYPAAAELIVGVLQAKPAKGEWSRRAAVQALADFPGSLRVVNALFDAMFYNDVAASATLTLKRLFESDHQIRDALNDILLLQYGHKGAGMETDIKVVREKAKSLVMRHFDH